VDLRHRLSGRWIQVFLVAFAFIAWRVSVLLISSKLEIGKETTFVTGPLKPDGSIDYPAALHERWSKGVTPVENAEVLIIRAFGPGAISPELRGQYFERLGIDPLPEQGKYIVTQSSLIQQKLNGADNRSELKSAMDLEFGRAQRLSWKRVDYPTVAEWLETNAAPLELIESATRLDQFYSPLVTHEGIMQADTTFQNLREATRLLATRAMFRLGEDDIDGAWNDLLAIHRLALLVNQHASSMFQFLLAPSLESVATNGDASLMAHALSADQARKCLADHDQLSTFRTSAEVMDWGQRLESLDAVLQQMPETGMDINTMLRRTNQMYDDLVSAMRKSSFAERKQALAAIDNEFAQRIATARKPLRQIANLIVNTRKAISTSVGDVLLSMLIPAYSQAEIAQMRAQIRRDLVRIGFAVTAYHAEQGVYPPALDVLVPKYLSSVPLDQFTEKPLVYVPREKGFLIYSIGDNGRDDGGLMGGPNKGDDVSLEVPPKTDE